MWTAIRTPGVISSLYPSSSCSSAVPSGVAWRWVPLCFSLLLAFSLSPSLSLSTTQTKANKCHTQTGRERERETGTKRERERERQEGERDREAKREGVLTAFSFLSSPLVRLPQFLVPQFFVLVASVFMAKKTRVVRRPGDDAEASSSTAVSESPQDLEKQHLLGKGPSPHPRFWFFLSWLCWRALSGV